MSIIYKLGGTSQCVDGYNKIANIIKNKNNFIILSAIFEVTNFLVKFTEIKRYK
jgi:aspartokinase